MQGRETSVDALSITDSTSIPCSIWGVLWTHEIFNWHIQRNEARTSIAWIHQLIRIRLLNPYLVLSILPKVYYMLHCGLVIIIPSVKVCSIVHICMWIFLRKYNFDGEKKRSKVVSIVETQMFYPSSLTENQHDNDPKDIFTGLVDKQNDCWIFQLYFDGRSGWVTCKFNLWH